MTATEATATPRFKGPTWFQDDSFMSSLDERVRRVTDSREPLSVIYLSTMGCSRRSAYVLYEFIKSKTRQVDFAGTLANGDYAFCLTNAGRRGASAVAARFSNLPGELNPMVGAAVLSEDGDTAQDLINTAQLSALL